MALTNISLVDKVGGSPSDPVFCDVVEFDFDADYQTGGYSDFGATLVSAGAIRGKTILAVVPVLIGGAYTVEYVRATDKLLVKTEALAEAALHADLHLIVDNEVLVISK